MNVSHMARVAAVALLTVGCGPPPLPAEDPSAVATAQRLMSQVRARYAGVSSYRDKGVVRSTIWMTKTDASTKHLEFTTAFVRKSGAFFFEYREAGDTQRPRRGVSWRLATGPAETWSPNDVVRSGSLVEVLSSSAGVSYRVSVAVPSLLLPSDDARTDLTARTFRVEGEELVGGHPCVKLAAGSGNDSFRLWVDQRTYAVRRTVRDEVLGMPGNPADRHASRDEVDYSPSFDEDIADAQFSFVPPQASP